MLSDSTYEIYDTEAVIITMGMDVLMAEKGVSRIRSRAAIVKSLLATERAMEEKKEADNRREKEMVRRQVADAKKEAAEEAMEEVMMGTTKMF